MVCRRQAALGSKFSFSRTYSCFYSAQLSIGNVEEVSRAARRVQDRVTPKSLLSFCKCVQRVASFDSLSPRPHDRRLDDFADVLFRRVVRAKRPHSLAAERALKQIAENGGFDQLPIEPPCLVK